MVDFVKKQIEFERHDSTVTIPPRVLRWIQRPSKFPKPSRQCDELASMCVWGLNLELLKISKQLQYVVWLPSIFNKLVVLPGRGSGSYVLSFVVVTVYHVFVVGTL